jgi:hypothetical protein
VPDRYARSSTDFVIRTVECVGAGVNVIALVAAASAAGSG